jgi:parallel beta-helix repeat protein
LEVYARPAGSLFAIPLALSVAIITGCGSTASTSTSDNLAKNPKNLSLSVTVSPSSVTLSVGQSQAFSASVSGSGNSGVSWFVNGIGGGNASLGTVSTSGLYVAPATVPGSPVSISAVSVLDTTKMGTAVVNFSSPTPNPPPPQVITVSIMPLSVTLAAGQSQTFSAAVAGSSNSQVIWLVNGITGGNSTLGIINASGLYIAPATVPNSPVSISAVSVADSSKSASAVVGFSSPPPPPPSGTNYYVSPSGADGNDGSQSHPWLTIQRAANVAKAGATVHVAPGSYTGAITTQTSGTVTARIRFVSDAQWGATIRAGSVDIVWTNLGDYVDIEGFDIAGSTADTCNGIINYASYVRIVGNDVHDVGHDTTACVFGSGIVNHQNRAGQDDDVIGNAVHDIGDINQTYQYHHGIYHANLRGHIWNNLVYRCQGWGIHLWHAANQVTIANNTVFNNGYGGILIGDGDDPGGFPGPVTNDNTVVSNNIVYRNGLNPGASGYGIEEYGLTGTHNQYLNNLMFQNGPANWNLLNGITAVGSISADPQFVNYQPDGSGNYHLAGGSPAANAGTAVGAPTIDMNGGARLSASPDLGAYQSNSAPGPWPFI